MLKHRYFKTDKFLKSVDIDLLRNYFSKYNITLPHNINFEDDSFDVFWNNIEENLRVDIEEELHCINDIADKARDCLERACQEFNITREDEETAETIAMRVFLYSGEAFNLAYDFYLYYNVTSEKVSRHKFCNVSHDFSDPKIEQFKLAIKQHFKNSGKSDNCDIRKRIDADKHIFLIARGDYRKTVLVFDEIKAKTNPHCYRPAKEDILVYDAKNNNLILNISSHNSDEKKKYIELFGNIFLGLPQIESNMFDNSLVELSPIKNQNFNYNGNELIEKVKLTEVKARLNGLLLTLKGDDLSGLLHGFGLNMSDTEYISAKLKFFIKRENKKSRQISIEIKPPETSKIPQRKEKSIIENYLQEQGVLLG